MSTTLYPANVEQIEGNSSVSRFVFVPVESPYHEFRAAFIPDPDDGGYTALALDYPEVISEGDSIEEARTNIADAFLGVVESHRKHGDSLELGSVEVPAHAIRQLVVARG